MLANLAPLAVFYFAGLICPAVVITIALVIAFESTRDAAREPEQLDERDPDQP